MPTVDIARITDNPFQARTTITDESVRGLADEIKAEGFWNTTLQGRKRDGKIELVFGHRRLRALRLLGTKRVEVDLVELTDAEMRLRSLEENFQREGLTDLEKADAVRAAVAGLEEEGVKGPAARVAERLGLDRGWVSQLAEISVVVDNKSRKVMKRGNLTAKTALAAIRFGGEEFLDTLADRPKDAPYPTHKVVEAFSRELTNIEDDTIRAQVKARIIKGQIKDPKNVAASARRLGSTRAARAKQAPPDLKVVAVRWTHELNDWAETLQQALPYMDYIDEIPSLASDLRKAAKRLSDVLLKITEVRAKPKRYAE